jgi:hypothetical protein
MSRKKRKDKSLDNLKEQGMPSDFAERHIAAYMYAASGECNCPACVALRPIAKIFYEKYGFPKKNEKVEVSTQSGEGEKEG